MDHGRTGSGKWLVDGFIAYLSTEGSSEHSPLNFEIETMLCGVHVASDTQGLSKQANG